jgi:hypothetical protein
MSLHNLRSPSDGHGHGQLWSAMREELREVAWLLALVGGLSVAGVALAALLAAL